MSFAYMAHDQSIKAKRVHISILNRLNEYGQLPNMYFSFDIFDTKISAIILYGCKIWGATEQKFIESIQDYECKR
jgi:hypothetical protein